MMMMIIIVIIIVIISARNHGAPTALQTIGQMQFMGIYCKLDRIAQCVNKNCCQTATRADGFDDDDGVNAYIYDDDDDHVNVID